MRKYCCYHFSIAGQQEDTGAGNNDHFSHIVSSRCQYRHISRLSDRSVCLLLDGLSHRLIFDESVQIKQLDVVEQHGIILFRAGDKGKESSVYVFRLREFESDASARCAELFNDRENGDRDKEEDDDDDEDTIIADDEDDRNDDDYNEDDADECDNFTRATAKFQPVGRPRARLRIRAPAVRSRAHIKERKLRRTRGCHLYSITRPGGSHLRMVTYRLQK